MARIIVLILWSVCLKWIKGAGSPRRSHSFTQLRTPRATFRRSLAHILRRFAPSLTADSSAQQPRLAGASAVTSPHSHGAPPAGVAGARCQGDVDARLEASALRAVSARCFPASHRSAKRGAVSGRRARCKTCSAAFQGVGSVLCRCKVFYEDGLCLCCPHLYVWETVLKTI